ncbi:hypothetical protein [Sorangium sp. So ce861]|uniref:hypothetical protein n=1 Tax=Sorangium sp. So ce861 TaxID=3133323 RepID=UPI003F6320DB
MKLMQGLLCAAAIGALTTMGCSRPVEASRESVPGASPASSAASLPAGTSVVLVADLAEADHACGCGEIIRVVRAAAQKGVPTKEIDTRTNKEEAKKYRVLVAPAVLLLDSDGKEARRYEGESSDTVASMKADLDALASASK